MLYSNVCNISCSSFYTAIKGGKVLIYDTTKNHDRLHDMITDYWDTDRCSPVKEFYKNVIDIRYVCEHVKEIKQTVIRGVRINNIFLSCEQLESITGKKINNRG